MSRTGITSLELGFALDDANGGDELTCPQPAVSSVWISA